jgi:hypothetical protein
MVRVIIFGVAVRESVRVRDKVRVRFRIEIVKGEALFMVGVSAYPGSVLL